MEMLASTPMSSNVVPFGRRKVVPRACIGDSKAHIRTFVRESLEDLGFATGECGTIEDLTAALGEQHPDLFVLGLSAGGVVVSETLEALASRKFAGKVLLFGAESSLMVSALLALGSELGLDMLPLLPTPFGGDDLREKVAALLPSEPPPNPDVDIAEAIHANWLELWYQPKIDPHSLTLGGAEALIRMRHPTWGTLLPASFLTDASDPHFRALSEFVMVRAIKDWRYFVTEYGPVELAINLPAAFFGDPKAIEYLTTQLPDHPAFQGLIVEVNSDELIGNAAMAKSVARQLRLRNVGVAIDDLGADWPLLLEFDDFPFVEIKVDRAFVNGCADDRLKQSTCARIIELADRVGARTVAEGVETRADFLVARQLGFDLIQGFFFAKPMEPHKFARRILGRPVTLPP